MLTHMLAVDIQVCIILLSDGTTDQSHTAFVYRSPPCCDYFLPLNTTQVASSFHLPVGHIQLHLKTTKNASIHSPNSSQPDNTILHLRHHL